VFRVPLKPLRERPEDLLPLARHFLERLGRQQKLRPRAFAPEAEALIRSYPWPGNVRELRNAVEHALIVEQGDVVQARSLPVSSATALPPAGHDQAIAALLEVLPGDYGQARNLFEGAFLKRLLQESRGNIAAAARRAGMSRCAIYRRLQALDLLPGGGGAEG
jgi:DNA-binding NtrC family response regulator